MKTINVKIKTIEGSIPEYATMGSAGVDLCSSIDCILRSKETKAINTGLFMEIPEGYEGQIRPRSGLALNNSLTILNSPGTIDSDYRGEIKIIISNFGEKDFVIKKGDRIAQMVFAPVIRAEFQKVSELNTTERNDGGFGHTGI
jgi:dUTP pyrophosphatase